MKQAYIKPVLFYGKEPAGIIPLAAAAVGLGLALGVSSSAAFAVGSAALAAGAAGLAAGGAAAGTAVAKKMGEGYRFMIPALDAVEVYV
jgi:hypothetical protein